MKTVVSSLHFQIPATGEVPEWVHLTPVGTFSGVDGRGPFRLEDAATVIADSLAAGKLPIDENHATDTAAPEGRPSPARGWIVAMEARGDGIWGKVEWTNAGRELLADKAYRGISPVLLSTKAEGRVLRILRAALTNDPNLNLTSLHSRSEPMEFVAKLRQALGLKDDATEDAVLAAVTSAHAAVAGRADDLKRFVEAAGLTAAATADQVVTHLNATRTAGGDLTALRQTVDARIADASDRLVARCGELRTAAAAVDLFAPEKLRAAVRQGDTLLVTVCTDPPRTAADLAITIGKVLKAIQAIEAAKRA